MEKIQVFIVSGNILFRRGLQQALKESQDIELVAESEPREDVLDVILGFSPEIALVDIGLPQMSGLNLVRQITQRSPAISVIVLTPFNGDDNQLFQTIKSGAAGYLTMDTSPADLVSAIQRIHRGEYILNELVLSHPKVAEKVLKQFQDFAVMGGPMESLATPLTARELEVLGLVAQGFMNKQIAFKLGVSEQTVKNHMTSILRKLDVNDRTHAVVLGLHYGWISSKVRESPEAQNGAAKTAARSLSA